jgi:phage terminase Nu1 subunit (DNA packaging protein)
MQVNQSELADVFGYSHVTVQTYRKQGMPVLRAGANKGQPNIYDTVDCYRWLLQKHAAVDEDDKLDGDQELAKLRQAQREKLEIQAAEMRRDLIPQSEAIQAWSAVTTAVRSRILAVPSRMRSRLPDMPKEAQDELNTLLREALDDLSRIDPLGSSDCDEDVDSPAGVDTEPVG